MVEIIDGVESIVMSLGSDKAASRGKLLGLEPAKVYELRTDVRKSNDAVKKGIASPLSDRPAPAVTAGSSPESRETKKITKSYSEASGEKNPQATVAMGLGSIGNGLPQNPKAIYDWAQKHEIDLPKLISKHGAGLTPKSARKNSPEFLALTKAFWDDRPFSYKGKKTRNEGIGEAISQFIIR